jgi:hypothetical protein
LQVVLGGSGFGGQGGLLKPPPADLIDRNALARLAPGEAAKVEFSGGYYEWYRRK